MKTSHFFAFLRRMSFIKRWSLMRNTTAENIQEHSMEVTWIAHHLALIKNRLFGGNVNVEKVLTLALYHEVSEIFTGDMPTPIKYFNAKMRHSYKEIEKAAQEKMLYTLPDALQDDFAPLLIEPEMQKEYVLVKMADTLSAFMKCKWELAAGNREFQEAHDALQQRLEDNPPPELRYFMDMYLPSVTCSVDELNYTMDKVTKKP